MPRQKLLDERVRIQAYIPRSLFVELQLNLPQDPLLDRPVYGAVSQLVTELIHNWCEQRAATSKEHSNDRS